VEEIKKYLKEQNICHVDTIINAAGGFEMESIQSDNVFLSMKSMYEKNCLTSLLAGHLAFEYLKPNG
jgi:hypothetical protein